MAGPVEPDCRADEEGIFVKRSVVLLIGASAPVTLAVRALACDGVPCLPTTCATSMPHLKVDPNLRLPYASSNVSLLSHLSLTQIGGVAGGMGSSLYGWTDPLTQHEYAIMGRSNGTAFVDVTNPFNPVYVANLPKYAGSADTEWREPKVYGNYAYIGVDRTNHPLQYVNLTQLRNYAGSTMTLSAGTYAGVGAGSLNVHQIHTMAINAQSGFLYLAGTNPQGTTSNPAVGLHIVDVRNPANPTFAGFFKGDDYTHEAQVVTYNGPDATYRGREIAFNFNAKSGSTADTFSIVDVTNHASPTRLASKTYTGAKWTHQGWLTEDQRYLFMDDESDESLGVTAHTRTYLWDVQDLNNPVLKGSWDNTTTAIDHNQYVKGDYLYQTNYTTGLRILRIGDLSSNNSSDWLHEVAYFDTFPLNDAQTFNGAWNNYPFFASGNVIVSDIDGGLFVLRPNLPKDDGPIGLNDGIPAVPEPTASAMLVGAIGLLSRRRRHVG
jgi:choice-of-anchor B domain-containing protein